MTVRVDRHMWVPMRDGVRLATDVHRPARSGRHPSVLLRTPYDRANAQAISLHLNALRLADAGYAVVLQDVRGRWDSEGDFTPFVNEARDGADTIEWVVAQRWSNGVVAMAGLSYCGYAAAMAARERPPSLRALIAALCSTRLFATNLGLYQKGDAFALGFNLAWMLSSLALRDRDAFPAAAAAAGIGRLGTYLRAGLLDHRPELTAGRGNSDLGGLAAATRRRNVVVVTRVRGGWETTPRGPACW